MKFGSLFAGIGGFDLGLERAGMECAWQVEIDEFCTKVLTKHWPDVPKYGDIRNVGEENLETVGLICGGFPCQDISSAYHGKRAGLAGERSGLWFEFIRIIDELVPNWVIIENVPALLKSNDGRDFTAIIQRLAEYGYGVCWRILDSKYFGAATSRKRLFIVAKFADVRGAGEVLFNAHEICKILPEGKTKGDTLPMCVGWDGGLSYERLRQCVATKTNAAGTGESDGIPGQLDRYRYRSIGNAVVPQVAEFIGRMILEVENDTPRR